MKKYFAPILALSFSMGLIACTPSANESSAASATTAKAEMPKKSNYVLSSEVKKLQDIALNGTHGYDITESLTTEVGPRLAGSPQEAKARDWAVAKFKALGLENVRVEEFTVPKWERGAEMAEIISPYPQPLAITALGGSSATPAEGIEAEIVYFPTYDDLEKAPMTDLEGKIVFISGRMEKAPDGAGYGPANKKRQLGATEASKRGASAVVIRSVGTDSHRFPHTGQMRYRDNVKPIPIGALSAPDADQLERILRRSGPVRLKLLMTPRYGGELPSGNVIGDIIGTEKSDEIILIGGHLDSWDQGTGAVDDGAGVGITAGTIQVLLESGLKPKRTIRLVAFGSEEIGLLGGFDYAKRHEGDLINHVLASESDFGAGKVYELKTSVQGEAREDLKEIQKALEHLGVEFSEADTQGGPDIIPLSMKGVPAIRLQQNGFDYFDLHHTPDDTFDKIDKDEMAQNVAAWATMVWMASEADVDYRQAGN